MIPRLQAFYGGPQDGWLHIPIALLRAYATMLPRLMAESSLKGVSVALIGAGNMEKRHAQSTISQWERAANGPPEFPQMSEEERIELYRESGFFEVEVVEVDR